MTPLEAANADERTIEDVEEPRAPQQRVTLLRGLLVAGLILGGAGVVAVSGYFNTPLQVKVLEGNFPVNAGALDLRDINSHNSPTVAVNPLDPRNIVIANRIDSPRFSCALHVSLDGGATWSQTPIPVPAGEEPKCYVPDVAMSSDGTMYMSYVTLAGLGNHPNAVWIVGSEDGGKTLTEPRRVLDRLAFQVRLVADPEVADRLYLTWLQAEETGIWSLPIPGNPILAQRSDDGGETWTEPEQVSDPERLRVVAGSPAVGPDGTLYVAYLDLLDDSLDYAGGHEGEGGPAYPGPWELVIARSADRGETWAETPVDAVVPSERIIVFLPDFPSVAVDPGGDTVYVAFHDSTLGDADVWLWRSSDAGATWERRIRVNDTPRGDGTTEHMPRLAVAPDGRLDVVYYDRRDDPEDVMTEVSLQSSMDEGEHFTGRVTLSNRAFDSRVGWGGDRNLPDLGSRLGVLSQPTRALAVWTDTRAGTEASGKQDLVRAVAIFSDTNEISGAAQTGLRTGGAAAVALGVGLLVWALVRRRRPEPALAPPG